jgi:hypothetical protein
MRQVHRGLQPLSSIVFKGIAFSDKHSAQFGNSLIDRLQGNALTRQPIADALGRASGEQLIQFFVSGNHETREPTEQ